MKDRSDVAATDGDSVAVLILGEENDQNFVCTGTLKIEGDEILFVGKSRGEFPLPPAGRSRLKRVDAGTALAFGDVKWYTVLGIRMVPPDDGTTYVPTGLTLKDVVEPLD